MRGPTQDIETRGHRAVISERMGRLTLLAAATLGVVVIAAAWLFRYESMPPQQDAIWLRG
jgi:hypothetical protein